MRIVCILLSLSFLAGCSTPKQDMAEVDSLTPIPNGYDISQNYINQLEKMCYAKIQRSIGETRSGRGIIWAECLNDHVRPVEKKNYPDKTTEIDNMYSFLIQDMKGFYKGHTTMALLQKRWTLQQQAIGYTQIRKFQDSYE